MDRDKKLIAKILADAELKKQYILQDAKDKASAYLKEKEDAEKEFLHKEINAIKESFNKQLEKEKDITYVERSKEILKAKQNILLDIFDLALKKLQNLPDKEYKQFLQKVLENNADAGDSIIVAEDSKQRNMIEKLPVFKSKKLKISSEKRNISGGVIITSKICEKDFSFEGLLEDKYQESFVKIAKQLF